MAWISLESNGQRTEFCDQEVTVQPGSEEAVSCLVRPDDLGPGSTAVLANDLQLQSERW